jgi:hypothetical protein
MGEKEGSGRHGFLSPVKIHRPRSDRNTQQRVPGVPVVSALTDGHSHVQLIKWRLEVKCG